MYSFFPEKIYEALKHESNYIKWDNYTTNLKKKFTTFKQSLLFDYDIKNSEVFNERFNELSALVDKNCPQYKTQFTVTTLNLPKNELIQLYEETNDTETKLFILSQIISLSYVDREFTKYIAEYVKLYETIPVSLRHTYSKYCSVKYFAIAPEHYMLNLPKDETFLPNMVTFIKNLVEEFKDIIDEDTLNHCYLQEVEHMIANSLHFLNNDRIIANNLDDVDLLEDTIKTQYINYSCSRAAIKDKKFEVYFGSRDFEKAFMNMKWLFEYVDKALEDPVTFFRGLDYYDKINNFPMAVIVRRMLKVAELFPEMKFELKNLTKEDKEFLTQDKEALTEKTSSYSTMETFKNFVNHVDNWFEGNKETIELLKSQPRYEKLVELIVND